MSVFRILNQAPQYLLANGQVNAGGKLYFYETDLSTPKDTWAEQAKTTLNANPVIMDAAGRTTTDVWGDGEYGVVMTDADDVVIWTRNNVEANTGTGTTIPALETGKFLTNDGSSLLWEDIIQVPDPTGLSNYYLASDGSGTPLWQQFPEIEVPDPEVVVATDSVRVGVSDSATKWLVQKGTGSATAGGGKTATASVTFGTAFAAAPHVAITPTTASACSTANLIPSWAVTSVSASGFTVTFSTVTGGTSADNFSGSNIISNVTFMWEASATVTVA